MEINAVSPGKYSKTENTVHMTSKFFFQCEAFQCTAACCRCFALHRLLLDSSWSMPYGFAGVFGLHIPERGASSRSIWLLVVGLLVDGLSCPVELAFLLNFKPQQLVALCRYETMILLRPNLDEEARDMELAKFEAYLQRENAVGIDVLVRGNNQALAYPIKGWVLLFFPPPRKCYPEVDSQSMKFVPQVALGPRFWHHQQCIHIRYLPFIIACLILQSASIGFEYCHPDSRRTVLKSQ